MFIVVDSVHERISMIDNQIAYKALISRDSRFDGVFYVGVRSTGIYCRPICPAKKPKIENCQFFETAAAAEKNSFRPCLRCRPELAPGNAPMDGPKRIAYLIMQYLEESMLNGSMNTENIAGKFKLSSRQLRRIVQTELGVSPIQLIQTRRLLLAKQLLSETSLPITDIAFSSGFSSLRRFNDAFSKHYQLTPTALRNDSLTNKQTISTNTLRIQLHYRPPYDWQGILEFLKLRMMKNVELITDESYIRTVRLGKFQGWIKIDRHIANHALVLEFTPTLLSVLPVLLNRIRHLFDLNARPDLINSQLSKDTLMKSLVENNPGQRLPGAFDPFELALRAILGQQITVKAATTLAGRICNAFGKQIKTPFNELTLLTPTPERIAKLSIDDIAKLGIISKRAECIIALAKAYSSNSLPLDMITNPETSIKNLLALPGIGAWTAQYVAMRALNWPDAFPKEDIAIRKKLGNVTAKQAEQLSQKWRPWRSYAVLHIWNNSIENLKSAGGK